MFPTFSPPMLAQRHLMSEETNAKSTHLDNEVTHSGDRQTSPTDNLRSPIIYKVKNVRSKENPKKQCLEYIRTTNYVVGTST